MELVASCVGFCGADLKALCIEAAIRTFRQKYPQVYTSDDKFVIDFDSIKVEKHHFLKTMTTITPAAHRGSFVHSRSLSLVVAPCLERHVGRIMELISDIFPSISNSDTRKLSVFAYGSALRSEEPFILAYQAQQVYYTKYPSNKKERMEWITVCKVKVRNSVPLEDGMVQAEITTLHYYQEENMAIELNLQTDINEAPSLLDAGIHEYIDPSEIQNNEEEDNEIDYSTSNDDDAHDDDEEEKDYSSDN